MAIGIVRYPAKLIKLSAMLLFVATSAATADEYLPRGLGHPNGAVHWYDGGCCNKQDCEPVEPGAIRQTADGYVVRYMTSRGFIAAGTIPHGSSAIRQSKDSQEHACANPSRVICIYIHMGM